MSTQRGYRSSGQPVPPLRGCAKRGCCAVNRPWEQFGTRGGKTWCLGHIPPWARLRIELQERTRCRVAKMGPGWWDICLGSRGYLVVTVPSKGKHRSRVSVYLSPNATPWHHGARNIIGRCAYAECVCADCSCSPVVDP